MLYRVGADPTGRGTVRAAALSRWLTGAGPGLLKNMARRWPPDPRRHADRGHAGWIDAAVADNRLAVDPAAVRVQLLAAELAEIRDGIPAASVLEVLSAAPLDAAAHRDAESELSSAILLGSAQQADLLLCLARRHGIAPGPRRAAAETAAEFRERLDQAPRPEYHPDGWACGLRSLGYAYGVLRERAIATACRPSRASSVV